jgi:elongation factor Ts
MQIAAINPLYLNETAVPAEVIEKEKEILTARSQMTKNSRTSPLRSLPKWSRQSQQVYKENCLLTSSS